jgi:DNA repair photolyase
LFAKPEAARLLDKALRAPSYRCQVMAMGTNTDPYQPIERNYRITRSVLEVLARFQHPVSIVTKSALIMRDIDILAAMAAKGLARVAVSVTTLDPELARKMEPRASTPPRRLAALKALTDAGIPTAVMFAPTIPGLNDHELEGVLAAAHDVGVRDANYVMLRLPIEVKDLFREWLDDAVPNRASREMSLVRAMRGGKDYDAAWGQRMRGDGPIAEMMAERFRIACRRLNLNRTPRAYTLDVTQFKVPGAPPKPGQQLSLFAG